MTTRRVLAYRHTVPRKVDGSLRIISYICEMRLLYRSPCNQESFTTESRTENLVRAHNYLITSGHDSCSDNVECTQDSYSPTQTEQEPESATCKPLRAVSRSQTPWPDSETPHPRWNVPKSEMASPLHPPMFTHTSTHPPAAKHQRTCSRPRLHHE